MFDRKQTLAQVDPALWDAIRNENRRQEAHIELIASENYTSPAVMEAQGSQLTNKYAEGCECVDVAEQLALDRVKQLFGAEAANVQPNSGSQANQAVFLGLAKPGDTILGMSLAMGGHLTHGSPVNMSGRWFNVVSYGLNEITTRWSVWRTSTSRASSLPVPRPIRWSSTGRALPAWPRTWAPSSWWTWRTTPA